MKDRNENRGLIHIYCGDGKGKTTAAMGAAVRAAGRGYRVLILRLLKTDDSGEVKALSSLCGIRLLPCLRSFGFSWNMTPEQKKEAAVYYSGQLELAWELAAGKGGEKMPADLLILDEAIGACSQGFIEEDRLIGLLRSRPRSLEVILTGRNQSQALLDEADYVTEMVMVRHPYEKGNKAREGGEY